MARNKKVKVMVVDNNGILLDAFETVVTHAELVISSDREVARQAVKQVATMIRLGKES